MSPIPRFCSAPECLRAAWREELCRGHFERLRRGTSVTSTALREEHPSPVARLVEAAIAYYEADDDERNWARRHMRLTAAALAYAESRGYMPPRKPNGNGRPKSPREEKR